MAAQVLDTYELIEDILLRLPLRQLLLAQRVNKKFHGVINDSRKVKRALFFESSSDIRAKFRFENTDRRPRYNHDFRWTHEGEDTKAVILLRNPFNEMYDLTFILTRGRLTDTSQCHLHQPVQGTN